MSVTDNRCRQATSQFGKAVEAEYQKLFPYNPAPEALWVYLAKIEERLFEKLAPRPLTRAEIDSFRTRAYKALRTEMVKIAATTKQPVLKERFGLDGKSQGLIQVD